MPPLPLQAPQQRRRSGDMTGRTSSGRKSRPRRRQATTTPSRRLPAGTPVPPRSQRDFSNSHIQIIPQPEPEEHFSDNEESKLPTHTNQSYLLEAEAGFVDGGKTGVHQRQTSGQTFADMARFGIGMDGLKNDVMASHEPQPLSNYLKFTKPKSARGVSLLRSEVEDYTRASSPSENMNESPSFMSRYSQDSQVTHSFRDKSATPVAMDPVTALHQHFDAVTAIFGYQLANPAVLQSTEGKRDGEIIFVIHPNGDIQAHQWSGQQFQWSNVGQYSYNRKSVEGVLGKEQLKGQKIGSTTPRNTLEFFIAITKQFEESSIAKASEPTGYEPGNRIRPAIPLMSHHNMQNVKSANVASPVQSQFAPPRPIANMKRPALALDTTGEPSRSFSSAGYPSQQTGLPTLSYLSNVSNLRNGGVDTPHDRFPSPSVTETSPLLRRQSVSPELKRVYNPTPRNNIALSQSGLLQYPEPLTEEERRKLFPGGTPAYARHLSGPPSEDMQLARKRIFQEEQQRMQQRSLGGRVIINEDSDTDEDSVKGERLNHYLNTVGPNVSPTLHRGMNMDGARQSSESQYFDDSGYASINNQQRSMESKLFNLSLNANPPHVNDQPLPTFQYPRPAAPGTAIPTSSGSNAVRADLRQSEPDTNYLNRQVRLYNGDHAFGNKIITPQNWNGPFLTEAPEDKPYAPCNRKAVDIMRSDDATFMKFWTSSTKFEREEAYLRQLEKTQPATPIGTLPAPIGTRPSPTTTTENKKKSYCHSIERVLLPVRENLLAYIEGEGTRDYFSRFAKPPAHCITENVMAAQSFFGEDYGKPIARIGRDARYRPLGGGGASGGGGAGKEGRGGGYGLRV
ncbi:hypothetical protein EJ08DRAFT_683104 [Tothia fuscella]|uniref:Uncharacterized protein n=1 Tax=Tothia fuscella TaxID=1048955 RepID=A0A9P4NHB1_9PEZI|nr:hypothetical protein EJ08DRAFT_683104 [Tothia fuscella]